MSTTQKTLLTVFIIVTAFLSIFFIGRYVGIKIADTKNSEKIIEKEEVKIKLTEKQIDSIYKELYKNQKVKIEYVNREVGIIKEIEKIVIEKPKDTVCNELYKKATAKINLLNDRIIIKDSISKKSDNIIKNQNNIIFLKDSIISYKDIQINTYKSMKHRSKKIGVGIQVGYGISVSENKVATSPYVGIGVSYNLFNF